MGCGCNKGLPEGQTRNAPATLVKAGWVMSGPTGWRRKGSQEIVSLSEAMGQEGYTWNEETRLWQQPS